MQLAGNSPLCTKHKVLGYYGGALQIDERPGGVTAECGPGH